MEENKKFMRIAIRKGLAGVKKGQTPFGASIVKGGKVIAAAHNEVWKRTDPTCHAEIQAIRKACKKLNTIFLTGCVLYSTVEPCPLCFSAIHWSRISKIVYGARISDAKAAGFNELGISNLQMKQASGSSIEIVHDFMREECIAIFKEWDKRNDKKTY